VLNVLNENYYTNEKDMRFEALQMLREVQAELTRLNFLEVISLMKPTNPLKKTVLSFEEDLNDLTNRIGAFIQDAKNDVEYQPSEEETEEDKPEENEETKSEEEDKPENKNKDKEKETKAPDKSDKDDEEDDVKESAKMVIDSSISKV
jgi:outer membrane biosynthesis protein TonB